MTLNTGSAANPSIEDILTKQHQHLFQFYQDIHKYPELSGEEKLTAKKVAKELRSLGLDVVEGVGGFGVLGILRNGVGPTSYVRAELDALPVTEQTGLPYKSRVAGKMHACGHDFQLAALIGTANVMTKLKKDWKGTLVFIAQPAEETSKGAKAMLADPQFQKLPKPDFLLALHTAGPIKKGTIGIIPGYALASVDAVDVTFKGKGTHGAIPEMGIDPFIMTAEFILKAQTVLGREKNASQPAVISVGTVNGGTRRNIIPEEVKTELTMRTFDPGVRKFLQKRLTEISHGIALTAGAPEPKVEIHEQSNATYNDPSLAERLKNVLQARFGKDTVVESKPVMASEDFSEFIQVIHAPAFYFLVGERDEVDPQIINHSPRFAPDFQATAPLAIHAMVASLMDLHPITGK